MRTFKKKLTVNFSDNFFVLSNETIGYHPVDINKDVIKLLFTVRDSHSLVRDMGVGGRTKR